MQKVIVGLVVFALIMMIGGCSSSTPQPSDNKVTVQTPPPTSTTQAAPAAKVEPQAAKVEPQATPEKKAEKAPEPAKKSEWLWVFTTEGSGTITDDDKQKVREAILQKWLKDKPYNEVKEDDFNQNMGQYEGCKVLTTRLIYSYGEYDFTFRSGKVEKQGDIVGEAPLQDGPDGHIDRRETIDDLIKELRFIK